MSQPVDLGTTEFQSQPEIRKRFFKVIADHREFGATPDQWFYDMAEMLKEFGYTLQITKGGQE